MKTRRKNRGGNGNDNDEGKICLDATLHRTYLYDLIQLIKNYKRLYKVINKNSKKKFSINGKINEVEDSELILKKVRGLKIQKDKPDELNEFISSIENIVKEYDMIKKDTSEFYKYLQNLLGKDSKQTKHYNTIEKSKPPQVIDMESNMNMRYDDFMTKYNGIIDKNTIDCIINVLITSNATLYKYVTQVERIKILIKLISNTLRKYDDDSNNKLVPIIKKLITDIKIYLKTFTEDTIKSYALINRAIKEQDTRIKKYLQLLKTNSPPPPLTESFPSSPPPLTESVPLPQTPPPNNIPPPPSPTPPPNNIPSLSSQQPLFNLPPPPPTSMSRRKLKSQPKTLNSTTKRSPNPSEKKSRSRITRKSMRKSILHESPKSPTSVVDIHP